MLIMLLESDTVFEWHKILGAPLFIFRNTLKLFQLTIAFGFKIITLLLAIHLKKRQVRRKLNYLGRSEFGTLWDAMLLWRCTGLNTNL